jgi:hypothetical protein
MSRCEQLCLLSVALVVVNRVIFSSLLFASKSHSVISLLGRRPSPAELARRSRPITSVIVLYQRVCQSIQSIFPSSSSTTFPLAGHCLPGPDFGESHVYCPTRGVNQYGFSSPQKICPSVFSHSLFQGFYPFCTGICVRKGLHDSHPYLLTSISYLQQKATPWEDTGSLTQLVEGSSLKDGSNVIAKIAPAHTNASVCLQREAHMYVFAQPFLEF